MGVILWSMWSFTPVHGYHCVDPAFADDRAALHNGSCIQRGARLLQLEDRQSAHLAKLGADPLFVGSD